MKTLFEEAIEGVNELIKIRMQMGTYYIQLEKSKESTAMQFKIKNYIKWLDTLKDLKGKNTQVKNQAEIKALKLSPSLETKLIELFENGEITDIDIAKNDLTNLERLVEIPDNLTSSTISASDGDDGDGVNKLTPTLDGKSKSKKLVLIKPKKKTGKDTGSEGASDAGASDAGASDAGASDAGASSTTNSIVKIDTSTIEAVPKILADIKRPRGDYT